MHMGSMTTVGSLGLKNFKHIIFNNASHDSVGAQPTCASKIDFCSIAKGCNYSEAFKVTTEAEIQQGIKRMQSLDGPVLMEI